MTFDDGPHPLYTNNIIDLLKKYNLKATFFVCGINAEKYPDILKKLVKNGHEIGNHTFSHRNMIFKKYDTIKNDIQKTDNLITEICGIKPVLFRPPYLRMDLISYLVFRNLNKKVILTTFSTKDYKAVNPGILAEKVITKIQNGDFPVFHDGRADRSITIQALETAIPQLMDAGFKFTTVSEIL